MTRAAKFLLAACVTFGTAIRFADAWPLRLIAVENDCGRASNGSSPNSEFPEDLFTQSQRLKGAILLHIFCGIYCFTLLAVVCNDYFLPAVELIIRFFGVPEDVGAATFMAMATSAPELCVNVIGTFVSKSDIGLGTIIGSSMFNTLGVAALGGLAASTPLPLARLPLTRDSVVYSVAICILVALTWDGVIRWYEAGVLLLLYVAYFVFIFSSSRLTKLFDDSCRCLRKTDRPELSREQSITSQKYTRHVEFDFMDYGMFNYLVVEYDEDKKRSTIMLQKKRESDGRVSVVEEVIPAEEHIGLFKPPKSNGFLRTWFFFTWPLRLVLFLTLPDCRRKPKLFPLTFVMCIVWIGANSYMVTWMIDVIGYTFSVPDSVMGMTFLAAGGCLPEAISIVIMSRKGNGNMGVSNSLGANTIDILLCLGLPWFIKTVMHGVNGDSQLAIKSEGIEYTILGLVVAVATLYTIIALNGFTLSRRAGVALAVAYLFFLTAAILAETHILFPRDVAPTC